MVIDQKALQSLSGPQQIIVMEHLKQEAAAWLLGVNVRTLRDHSGEFRRDASDNYEARDVLATGLSTGLLKLKPVELTDDEQEQCIRSAEFLTGAYCEVSPAIMRLIRGLEEKYGDRGLAEFVRLVRKTWIEDYQGSETDPPPPNEEELREKIESELRSQLNESGATQLKRGVICENCGKVRRGTRWLKTATEKYCLKGTCPDCQQQQRLKDSHRPKKKTKAERTALLAEALMDDDE